MVNIKQINLPLIYCFILWTILCILFTTKYHISLHIIDILSSETVTCTNNKIAFLFLTRDNLLAKKVWDNFFGHKNDEQYYNIYVHAKYPQYISKNQSYLYNNCLPDNALIQNTARMEFSLVEASNVLFRTAFNDDKCNKKFILLSESHIPLYNFTTIYSQLIHNNQSYFGDHSNIRASWIIAHRYDKIRKNYLKSHNNNSTRFVVDFVDFKNWFPSNQWIVLDRYLIENYLLKYELYWNNFFKDAIAPDENYYSTLFKKYLTQNEWKTLITIQALTYAIVPYHAKLFHSISNKFIDKLRRESFMFIRKADANTRVNISYLLYEPYISYMHKSDKTFPFYIFQIGYNKCGTKSLYNFFQSSNKIPSIHYKVHFNKSKVELRKIMDMRFRQNKSVLEDFAATYRFYSDFKAWISPSCNVYNRDIKWYEILTQQYPGSKFILNIRYINHWLKSRYLHFPPPKNHFVVDICKGKTNNSKNTSILLDIEILKEWKYSWYEYICDLLQYFKENDILHNLLIFDIETDSIAKLVTFFAKDKLLLNGIFRHLHHTAKRMPLSRQRQNKRWINITKKYPQFAENKNNETEYDRIVQTCDNFVRQYDLKFAICIT